MDAPTNQEQIKAAYRRLYSATANAMSAAHDVSEARSELKSAEAIHTSSGALDAGKNADARAAILYGLTTPERITLRTAEDAYAAADLERTLAQIAVNELRELLRLAEWHSGQPYYTED